jgi:hypothetical protein
VSVRRRAAWRALGFLCLAAPVEAAAQTCTAPIPAGTCSVTTSVTLTVGKVLQLTLSATNTTLTAPSEADYDAGFVADAGPTATVQSNAPWVLQVSAAAATWTAASTEPGVSARANKPAGDLLWATAAGGPFTALSTAAVTAGSGVPTAGIIPAFFYRTAYDWTLDTPGAYSLTVVFTLTAP